MMSVASHDLFNMKLRTCIDTGVFREPPLKQGYYVFTKEMAEVKLFEMFCNKAEKYPICKDSEEKEDAVSYDKIKDYALAISKFAITWQKINNTDDDLIQKIFKLNSSLPMKIFLCALNEKKTTEENFQTALRFTEKILFRNAIFVFTMDERIFSEFARDLYAGEPYEAVVNELRAKVDSVQITTQTLELVANNFAGLYEYERGNKGFHRWQGLKYLLFEYEQFLKVENKESYDKVPYSSYSDTDIEHIIPKSYQANWSKEVEGFVGKYNADEQDLAEKVILNTLGNLTILKDSKNRSLKDNAWLTQGNELGKKDRFSTGSYNEIEVSKNSAWTKDTILSRGRKILNFIVVEKLGFKEEIPDNVYKKALFYSPEMYDKVFDD